MFLRATIHISNLSPDPRSRKPGRVHCARLRYGTFFPPDCHRERIAAPWLHSPPSPLLPFCCRLFENPGRPAAPFASCQNIRAKRNRSTPVRRLPLVPPAHPRRRTGSIRSLSPASATIDSRKLLPEAFVTPFRPARKPPDRKSVG